MSIYLKKGINVVEVLEFCGYTIDYDGDQVSMATKVVDTDEDGEDMVIFISLDDCFIFNQDEITWDKDQHEDSPLKYDLYDYIKDLEGLDAVETR